MSKNLPCSTRRIADGLMLLPIFVAYTATLVDSFVIQPTNHQQWLGEVSKPLASTPSLTARATGTRRVSSLMASAASGNGAEGAPTAPSGAAGMPPQMLNGKRFMPWSIVRAGVKATEGGSVPAVYAIQRTNEASQVVVAIGFTLDLEATQAAFEANHPSLGKAQIRALSYSTFRPEVMQTVVDQWKEEVIARQQEEPNMVLDPVWVDPSIYLLAEDDDEFDDDDDDDWEDEEDSLGGIVSPFAGATAAADTAPASAASTEESSESSSSSTPGDSDGRWTTIERVNEILDEVRPYLISDGGNVGVVAIHPSTKTIDLELQGACGSCPSSTVTMQMGIERVLREQLGPDVQVRQVNNAPEVVEDDFEGMKGAVQAELDRMAPAMVAMGGVVRIANVDDETGVVQLEFQGPNRVRQGLELAILDNVPSAHAVQFVMPPQA